LLVVIAVILVFVGLMLPAVQAAREAARRMRCSINLKQVTLATHNYESALKALPTVTGSSSFSAQARILPHIEQADLDELFDFELPLFTGPAWMPRFNPALRPAIETVVPTFSCPCDPGDRMFGTTYANNAQRFTTGVNYMFSYGIAIRRLLPNWRYGLAGLMDRLP
jgi:hypothetical protein